MFKKMEKSFYYGFPVVLMTTKDEMTDNDNLTPINSTWQNDCHWNQYAQ